MRKYSCLKVSENLPQDVLELISSIHKASIREEYRREAYRDASDRITDIAKLASVKFSNEIENIVSSDDRILELVKRGGDPVTTRRSRSTGTEWRLTSFTLRS